MGFKFGTVGSGQTDKIVTDYTARPIQYSQVCWTRIAALPSGGGNSYWFAQNAGSTRLFGISVGSGGITELIMAGFATWDDINSIEEHVTDNSNDLSAGWTMVTVEYDRDDATDSTRMRFYRGNTLIAKGSSGVRGTNLDVVTGAMAIGNSVNNDRCVNGRLAEAQIYNYLLGSTNRAALAGGDSPMTLATPPVWYNRMKDGVTGANAQVGTVTSVVGAVAEGGDHPAVDDPPAAGGSAVPIIAHHRRLMEA